MEKLLLILIAQLLLSCSGDNYKNMGGHPAEIRAGAMHSLETEEDLDILLDEIAESQLVLLGEASHGTSEFYTWRAAISRRLIVEEGFNLIGVEGDWADVAAINKYIMGNSEFSNAEDALEEFNRWPQWMWANEEVAELAEWLRNYNAGKPQDEKVGFYGLDVYGIWESLDAVIAFLDRKNPEAAQIARQVQECFAPYNRDEQAYARATINSSEHCAEEVAALLETVENIVEEEQQDITAFNALQNARVVAHAESYYRAAVRNSATSWNVRDAHMMGTVNQLIDFHGDNSKIIIWEHNTHVGDARATDMIDDGMINIGQLAREQYGEDNSFIVGFGTYSGRVIAAQSWGSRRQVMYVPGAQRNSWEWLLHRQGPPKDKIIFSEELAQQEFYQQRIGHRAIGVVYNPDAESGNYVPSVIPQRYDAFIFIDKTTALKPLD